MTNPVSHDDRRIRVSVVIPAFNAEAYIADALASVQGPGAGRVEILVIDDASTDGTATRVRAAAATDNRIRLLSKAENAGPATARNAGLDAARGEWIALLDADDRFHPRRLATLLELAEERGADMVSDNLLLVAEDGTRPPEPLFPLNMIPAVTRLDAAAFLIGSIGNREPPSRSFGFMQPVIRRAFLEEHGIRYDENGRFGEDFIFCMKCLMHGAVWWVTPEPLYLYTQCEGSLTGTHHPVDLDRMRRFEQGLLDGPAVAGDPALAQALRRHKRSIDRWFYYRVFTDAVKGGDLPGAARTLFDSPGSLALIAGESLVQGPRILAKALRGGYRVGRQEGDRPAASADAARKS